MFKKKKKEEILKSNLAEQDYPSDIVDEENAPDQDENTNLKMVAKEPQDDGAKPAASDSIEGEGSKNKNGIFSRIMQKRTTEKELLQEDEKDNELLEDDFELEAKEKKGIFSRFKKGLSKTRKNISEKLSTLVKSNKKLDEDFWEELEEILIEADVGVNTSVELVEKVRDTARKRKINDSSEVSDLIQEQVRELLQAGEIELNIPDERPIVILVVGVNGAGKTTSIAKMAYRFKQDKLKVILAAADTFRAAAIDQLQVWADRVGVDLIKHQEGADPGAVVFDAIQAARARKADILIIDTAGRLQNKSNLMKEISKIRKVIEREIPGAPHEVLLVLDACTGQNAISQARIFEEATGVTGIILTKLDGTAKGGIVLAIARELKLPVKLVGIGEKMDDLRDFEPEVFAAALFEDMEDEE
ncbi:signal recognition particle-docking protein FtsY [Syntrophomonas palmitatica]|uniref:signal recognition particle-docking protein FtsY n=1 Tax=Syntrophomonas palmitatica TaxID=402877 RepID=UPI0009FAA4FB